MVLPISPLQVGIPGGPELIVILLVLVVLFVVTILFLAVGFAFAGGAYFLYRRSQRDGGDGKAEGPP